MNIKRYAGSAFALFVFIFLFEWLVHGLLLQHFYHDTPHIWRDYFEMQQNLPLTICFKLALAFWTAFAFCHIYKSGGAEKGLLFGLFFGIFAGILTATWYLYLPVSPNIGWAWFGAAFIEFLFGGLILGIIYKK